MNRRDFISRLSAVLGIAGIGAVYWPGRWKYIVIHHSAGDFGSIEFIQKVHRERQSKDPIDAIPYHYLIGNGNGLGVGEVASDWRKELNIWGAHVSVNNTDRNLRGLGICLIGNFEEKTIHRLQYKSLVTLTKSLMLEHNIAVSHVSGHGYTSGEYTKCPGKNFPMEQFLMDLV